MNEVHKCDCSAVATIRAEVLTDATYYLMLPSGDTGAELYQNKGRCFRYFCDDCYMAEEGLDREEYDAQIEEIEEIEE